MTINNKICPNCGETFEPNHGNRIYCDDKCYDGFKKKKQRENNTLMKQFRAGFLANYKLFLELQPESGTSRMRLLQLLKKGFDQDAFYGTVLDKEKNEWHKINDYAFKISKEKEQPVLYLYKQ